MYLIGFPEPVTLKMEEYKNEAKDELKEEALLSTFKNPMVAATISDDYLLRLNKFFETQVPNIEEAGKMARVMTQEFVLSHPHLAKLDILECPNAICGGTSTGKDKVVEDVVGHNISNSGINIATRVPEVITQLYDHAVSTTTFTLTDIDGRSYDYTDAIASTRARVDMQNSIRGFPRKVITLRIRSPDETTQNVTLHNLPGTIDRAQPGGEELFQATDGLLTRVSQQKGVVFIVRKITDSVPNETWPNFSFINELKLGHPLPIKVVFVMTCGDLMSIPATLRSYVEAENHYFGPVRGVLPNAECYIVANSNIDEPGMMQQGKQKAEAEFQRKLADLDQTIANNNPGESEVARNGFMDKMGMAKVRQLFWATAAQKASEPLQLIMKCFREGAYTLLNNAEDEIAKLHASAHINWAELMRKFSNSFFDAFPSMINGAVKPVAHFRTIAMNSVATAEEEYNQLNMLRLKLPPGFDPRLWRDIITSDDNELNPIKHFSLHMRLNRFWANIDQLIGQFAFTAEDWVFINASVQRDPDVAVMSRSRVCAQLLTTKADMVLSTLAELLSTYIAFLCFTVTISTKEFVLDGFPQFLSRPDILDSVNFTLGKIYLHDLKQCLYSKIEEMRTAFNVADVTLDLHEMMSTLTGVEADWCSLSKNDIVLSSSEWDEAARATLDDDAFAKLMHELGSRFHLMIRLQLMYIRDFAIPSVLSKFGFKHSTHETAEFLFKHLMIEMPNFGQTKAFKAVVGENLKYARSSDYDDLDELGRWSLNKTQIYPPGLCHVDTVTHYNLTGLVFAFDPNLPEVLHPNYFIPLCAEATIRIMAGVNRALTDTSGRRRHKLDQITQCCRKVRDLVSVLPLANTYFETHFKLSSVVPVGDLRQIQSRVDTLNSQIERLNKLIPAPDFD